MKPLIIILLSISFFVGFISGYKVNDSHYSETKSKLQKLTENELDEYLKLKSLEEKYKKADEILGKAIMIFLADLGLRISDDKVEFAKKALTQLSSASDPAPDQKVSEPNTSQTNSGNPESAQQSNNASSSAKAEMPVPDTSANGLQNENPSQSIRNTGLSGKIRYTGILPRPDFIRMSADPVCAQENKDRQVQKEDLLVSKDGGLKNVFIYVKEGSTLPPGAFPTTPVELDQRGCVYSPHVAGIRVGQKLKILNSDPVLHNVHSMAKLNVGFNMGMATKNQVVEKSFTKPEVMVKIKCDVHGWMNSYIGVLDHPYFSVSQADGSFSIPNLPPGRYTIEAWHEKLGIKTQAILFEEENKNKILNFNY